MNEFDDVDNKAILQAECNGETMSGTDTEGEEDAKEQFEVSLFDKDHNSYSKSNVEHVRDWIECYETHTL